MAFKHGVFFEEEKLKENIVFPQTGIIAIWGTSKKAATDKLEKPYVVIRSKDEAVARFGDIANGETGSLARSLYAIYELSKPICICYWYDPDKLEEDFSATQPEAGTEIDEAENETTLSSDVLNVAGRRLEDGSVIGIEALSFASESGFNPDIFIAPIFSARKENLDKLASIAHSANGRAIADCLDQPITEVIKYPKNYGADDARDRRIRFCYPTVIANVSNADYEIPASAIYAAIYTRIDYFESPSNKPVPSVISRLKIPISFIPGSSTDDASLLNQERISTFINDGGWRSWGNRGGAELTSSFTFESVANIDNVLKKVLRQTLKNTIDDGITKGLATAVVSRMNETIREQIFQGAILGGEASFSREENSDNNISQGKTRFRLKYTPVYPNEELTVILDQGPYFIEELF